VPCGKSGLNRFSNLLRFHSHPILGHYAVAISDSVPHGPTIIAGPASSQEIEPTFFPSILPPLYTYFLGGAVSQTSTKSVQLERSERDFACFWVANRAAKSTSYLSAARFVNRGSPVQLWPSAPAFRSIRRPSKIRYSCWNATTQELRVKYHCYGCHWLSMMILYGLQIELPTQGKII